MGWIQTMGMLDPSADARGKILAEFDDPGPRGRARRAAFQRGIEDTASEFHGLGIEMGQRYGSRGVYLADEEALSSSPPPPPSNPVREYVISTYPGKRLPHAWLNTRTPGKKFSTIDVAGHRRFCLLTGPGGEGWKVAAEKVGKVLGMEIAVCSIGWRQDYEDVYFDWARRREVEEDGCVLVRPDRFVAWRAREYVAEAEKKLEIVMRSILSLE
ncbi:unnamed protein product [Discula destructiva]